VDQDAKPIGFRASKTKPLGRWPTEVETVAADGEIRLNGYMLSDAIDQL